ncbi:hypothetical protein [Phyllobacterium sp. SB3]|uniref:hypothetical protein n=1 Tax=Phyllobacterium sp. SB3 TaxID=3156073 RepID=UPI0032AF46AA
MSYSTGDKRDRRLLLSPRVEDYVSAQAAVRVIDAFVEGLDLAVLGFDRAIPASTGCPRLGSA